VLLDDEDDVIWCFSDFSQPSNLTNVHLINRAKVAEYMPLIYLRKLERPFSGH